MSVFTAAAGAEAATVGDTLAAMCFCGGVCVLSYVKCLRTHTHNPNQKLTQPYRARLCPITRPCLSDCRFQFSNTMASPSPSLPPPNPFSPLSPQSASVLVPHLSVVCFHSLMFCFVDERE